MPRWTKHFDGLPKQRITGSENIRLGSWHVRTRVDGVETLAVLQRVCANLVTETDPAALMAAKVDKHAAPLGGNPLEGHLKLLAAVTSIRREDIAGQAFGVQANKRIRRFSHVPHHVCQMLFTIGL